MTFKKGMVPWNKGLKGYLTGRVIPEALKKKISESCKGRKPGMLGKNHSEKTKSRLRESKLLNNPGGFESGENHRMWKGGSKAYYGVIAHEIWEGYWMQKVPEGQIIHHFDGNRRNFEVTNLVNMLFGLHSRHHRLKESRSLS